MVSTGAYWCLPVPTGPYRFLLVSTGPYWFQGEAINRIELHILQSGTAVHKGQRQLRTAREQQGKARRKRFMMAACLVLTLVILITIIAASVTAG
ncbi:syntaxin-4-like [Phasianus colchicus]|uniref:syntaxin-4-like n=1 Tax=Phasianus colchicus TaxID=9054 RepID=UPI00129EFCC9|nr:syntaxin-4-like [Phasianus colchicus]